MIKTFRHKGLEKFFLTGNAKGVSAEHARKLADVLDHLNAASEIRDMNYPGSGLHPLLGKQKGFWAIKVSGNWRVIFRFENGQALDVDYVDYH